MLIAQLAPYTAIIVTLLVWTLTQRANRKHEIFKERLKRRVEMFDGLMPEISNFVTALNLYSKDNQNAEALQACQTAFTKLGDYRVKMLCYGTVEEQVVYEEFIDVIDNRKMSLLPSTNKKLVDLVTKNLRHEIGL